MRIESFVRNQPVANLTSTAIVPKLSPDSSVESLRGEGGFFTSITRGFQTIWRTVIDFIWSIFARFFPDKVDAPVKKEEIHFAQRTIDPKQAKYQILHKGISTNNEIPFRKDGEVVYLSKIVLTDSKTKEYFKPLLGHMLKQEKAQAFAPEYLDTAKFLWDCDYITESTILFDWEGKDAFNTLINQIVKTSQEKRESLGPDSIKALQNIEAAMHPEKNLIGSFVDLAATVVRAKSTKVQIPLSDLFTLMVATNITLQEGKSFASIGSELPLFKKR